MPIKWKSRAGIRPEVILQRIENAKSVTSDGRVSYSALDYHDAFAALFSMLEVPARVSDELSVDSLLSRGLAKAAAAGLLTKGSVISCINELAKAELATREMQYHLLTSLSVSGWLPFRRIECESSVVRVAAPDFPRKYSSRDTAIRRARGDLAVTHAGYTKVIVSTKSKSRHGASSKALRSLDVLRAVLCLLSNSSMELLGDANKPINKVRLGQTHTLHDVQGKTNDDLIWYEPNFVQDKPFSHQRPNDARKSFRYIIRKLRDCPYSGALVESLLRYVRALDEKDQNSAAIRLWGALECLASPGGARYESITKRCSFIFEEHEYHRQILEHLREFRNSSVHAGEHSERAKTFCYQMQFYFSKLLIFHLNMSEFCGSLDQANQFLDLPPDGGALRERKRLIEKALEFREAG